MNSGITSSKRRTK